MDFTERLVRAVVASGRPWDPVTTSPPACTTWSAPAAAFAYQPAPTPARMAAPWMPPSVAVSVWTGWPNTSALIWFHKLLAAPPPVQRTGSSNRQGTRTRATCGPLG